MHHSTFEYLKPTDEQISKMARVRAAAKAFNDVLEAELPEGPDKTFTIRGHRSNAIWANIAITRLSDGDAAGMIERQMGDIYFVCDSCSKATEPLTSDFSTAWSIAKRDGWRSRKIGNDWQHECPNCH